MKLLTLISASVALLAAPTLAVGPGPHAQTRRLPVPKAPKERTNDSAAEELFFETKLDHFVADGKSSTF